MTNRLYYRDNLSVLRDPQHFPGASVDLIYSREEGARGALL